MNSIYISLFYKRYLIFFFNFSAMPPLASAIALCHLVEAIIKGGFSPITFKTYPTHNIVFIWWLIQKQIEFDWTAGSRHHWLKSTKRKKTKKIKRFFKEIYTDDDNCAVVIDFLNFDVFSKYLKKVNTITKIIQTSFFYHQ